MFYRDARGGLAIEIRVAGEVVRLSLRPRSGRDRRRVRHGLRLGIDAPPGSEIEVVSEGDFEVEEPTPMAHEAASSPDRRPVIYGHIGGSR